MPVVLHPQVPPRAVREATYGGFDDLQLVLGHRGELLLFWQDRIQSLARVAGLQRPMADYLRHNLHVTSSGMLNPTLLRHVLDVTTPDRLLFSTDHPFQRPDREAIAGFLTALPDNEAREQLTHGNAEVLFGIDPALAAGA